MHMIDQEQINKKVHGKRLRNRWSFTIFVLLVLACFIIHHYQGKHAAPSAAGKVRQEQPVATGNTLPGTTAPATANRPAR